MTEVASRNIKFVSHSDLGGRGDGVQIMVHRGHAYVGHGFSACPRTRAFHLQTHDDLLLALNAPQRVDHAGRF